MRKLRFICAGVLCAVALLGASSLNAAEAKTYQVTGPVLEVTPTTIVVQKGKDRWEVLRDQNTKLPGDLKVGDKVTISYKMVAEDVEPKAAKPKK